MGELHLQHLGDPASAERCYRRVTELDPSDVQGRHNLCVVMVETGRMREAAGCLREAQKLADKARFKGREGEFAYVARHLRVVEERIRNMESEEA